MKRQPCQLSSSPNTKSHSPEKTASDEPPNLRIVELKRQLTTKDKFTAIYVRVSSRGQSHESQMPDLERWVASHDGKVHWYKDSFTGKTMNRPGQNDEGLVPTLRRTLRTKHQFNFAERWVFPHFTGRKIARPNFGIGQRI